MLSTGWRESAFHQNCLPHPPLLDSYSLSLSPYSLLCVIDCLTFLEHPHAILSYPCFYFHLKSVLKSHLPATVSFLCFPFQEKLKGIVYVSNFSLPSFLNLLQSNFIISSHTKTALIKASATLTLLNSINSKSLLFTNFTYWQYLPLILSFFLKPFFTWHQGPHSSHFPNSLGVRFWYLLLLPPYC